MSRRRKRIWPFSSRRVGYYPWTKTDIPYLTLTRYEKALWDLFHFILKKNRILVFWAEYIMSELISYFLSLFYIFPWFQSIFHSVPAKLYFAQNYCTLYYQWLSYRRSRTFPAWSVSQETGCYSLAGLQFLPTSAHKNDRKCHSSGNTVALYSGGA
jgi:hypothetical protein